MNKSLSTMNFRVTCKKISSQIDITTRHHIPKDKTFKLKKEKMTTLKNML